MKNQDLVLYSFFNSSAAYRVRIALHHKKLDFEYRAVHLIENGGEQNKTEFQLLNPMAEVPTLVHKNRALSQSMAILLYLDSEFSNVPLFSSDSFLKAQMIQFCEMINSGIHPIQNLKVRQELGKRFGLSADGQASWCAYWIERGFGAIEKSLEKTAGTYCFNDQVSAADMFLIPQVFNARRYQVDLTRFPLIKSVDEACAKLTAFQKAHPSQQPDHKA
jgi:maleylacetoacetate isomerase